MWRHLGKTMTVILFDTLKHSTVLRTGFSLVLALLHQTPILERYCKDHRSKQFFTASEKVRNSARLEFSEVYCHENDLI